MLIAGKCFVRQYFKADYVLQTYYNTLQNLIYFTRCAQTEILLYEL